MDTNLLLEKLAHITHSDIEMEELVKLLPIEFRNAFIANDSQRLRKILSAQEYFFDSKMVVQG